MNTSQTTPDSQCRLATYNVCDLFLRDEGQAKPASALRPLLRMIRQVDADVMVLQEVGSWASLKELNDRLASPYPYFGLIPGNSNRSIHIGVLSRWPIALTSHRAVQLTDTAGAQIWGYADAAAASADCRSPLMVQRDLLRIDVYGLPNPLTLFGLHLKSRAHPPWQLVDSDAIRAAEVRALTRLLAPFDSLADHAVAVLGDFNDHAASPSMLPLQSLGLRDPQGDLAKCLGRNPSTFWSHRGMRLDRIYLNEAAHARLVEESPTIHSNRMAQTASDHYPVSLALQF